MISFSELYSHINELKQVNLAQRRKQALRMKKLAKSAAFKKKVLDKYYPNYQNMPMMQKIKIDAIVAQKYGGMINKIATKSLKVVKKNELQKVKDARDTRDA